MLIRAKDIAGLRTAAVDDEETKKLKLRLAAFRAQRQPFWLNGSELEPILRWKLRGQYGRQQHIRSSNPDEVYRVVTQAAFSIVGPDPQYELVLRTRLLMSLPGIGVPVASAVLALVEPNTYCVIDFRGWRVAYGEDRREFSIAQYSRYRRDVAALARELGWSTQETDLAMWEYDRRRS